MNDELAELAEALTELGEQMSDMSVARLGEGRKRKAKNTTAARRAARQTARSEVEVVKVDQAAMNVAKALAGGDMSRVKVQQDGSVMVVN